jgi:hypothetical protein
MRCAFDRAGAVTVLAALALAACAESGSGRHVNLSGFPPAFQQGYAEGCESAGTGRTRRDEGRYRADEDYMQGWNDGYGVCRRR